LKEDSFLYVDDNGKLQLSAIQPEFKEGLKWANSLYSKGLIDPGAFTRTLDQLSQLVNDPSGPKMGVFTAGHLQMGIDINNIELSKQYDVLPPLVDTAPKRGSAMQSLSKIPPLLVGRKIII
jgi:putative aldouronate transport system substrate-binding protein